MHALLYKNTNSLKKIRTFYVHVLCEVGLTLRKTTQCDICSSHIFRHDGTVCAKRNQTFKDINVHAG